VTLKLPPLPSVQPEWGQFQVWWQQIKTILETQETLQDLALASLSEVAPITITADYQGTVDANQLPYEVAIKRFYGDTDVTTDTAWSVATTTGDITASIGAATGILSISDVGTSGTLTVSSDYNGVIKTRLVPVTLTLSAPPTSSGGGTGGGTTSSDTTFNSISSTSHTAISDELTVTVSSSGTVTLSASLLVRTNRAAPTGTFPVKGKWQWWDGAAWVDLAAEVESDPDCEVTQPETIYEIQPGDLTVNDSKSGLGAGSSQKFRLMARNTSGTRTMSFSGTASAVP